MSCKTTGCFADGVKTVVRVNGRNPPFDGWCLDCQITLQKCLKKQISRQYTVKLPKNHIRMTEPQIAKACQSIYKELSEALLSVSGIKVSPNSFLHQYESWRDQI